MKKIRNIVFLILMTLFGFVLLPLECLMFVMSILFVPIDYYYYKYKYPFIAKKYVFMFLFRYRHIIKCYKLLKDKLIVYDNENKFFIVTNNNINYIVVCKGYKNERCLSNNPINLAYKNYNIKVNKIIRLYKDYKEVLSSVLR